MPPIEIKVLSTTAMKTVSSWSWRRPSKRASRAIASDVTLGPSLRLEQQLAEGEAADVAIVSAPGRPRPGRERQDGGRQRRRYRQIVDRGRGAQAARRNRTFPRSKASGARCSRRDRSPARSRSAAARAAFTSPRFSSSSASPTRCGRKPTYGAGGEAGLVRPRPAARRRRHRHSADVGADGRFRHRRGRPAATRDPDGHALRRRHSGQCAPRASGPGGDRLPHRAGSKARPRRPRAWSPPEFPQRARRVPSAGAAPIANGRGCSLLALTLLARSGCRAVPTRFTLVGASRRRPQGSFCVERSRPDRIVPSTKGARGRVGTRLPGRKSRRKRPPPRRCASASSTPRFPRSMEKG